MRWEVPENCGECLQARGIAAKYRAGSENEASGSAQPWNPTNVWGDVVDSEDYGNCREYWEADEWPRSASDM